MKEIPGVMIVSSNSRGSSSTCRIDVDTNAGLTINRADIMESHHHVDHPGIVSELDLHHACTWMIMGFLQWINKTVLYIFFHDITNSAVYDTNQTRQTSSLCNGCSYHLSKCRPNSFWFWHVTTLIWVHSILLHHLCPSIVPNFICKIYLGAVAM